MKNWIKIVLVLAALGLAGASFVYIFMINKAHPDYEKEKAVLSISAEELFNSYRENSVEAAALYNGKIIEISGKLSDIELNENQTFACFVMDEGMFGNEGIRISILSNHKKNIESIPVGDRVTIKGFVTGYNDTDIILEFGSIVN